ncbi:SppA protein [Vibrio cholerae]|nr:SppA protein [Vibrio cholerae]
MLVLTTQGGDPDYGYRIGRAINYYYDNTIIMIPDICKSAGTLVAIAGKKLIIGDLGELGPLDIQFRKSDEMGEHASTLNIFKTVNELQNATLDSFRHFVTDIRYGSGIGTKLSSEIASNLTKALISPIAAQIDPIKLGEHNRALQVAREYANRLNQVSDSLKTSESLDRLISGYPCHSFVIDRKEARQLFKRVAKPENAVESFIYLFSRHYLSKVFEHAIYMSEAEVVDFNNVISELHCAEYEESSKSSETEKNDTPEEELA